MDIRKKNYKLISAKLSKQIFAKKMNGFKQSFPIKFPQNFSNVFLQNFPNGFSTFLKGPNIEAEGCSPPQELEKSACRAAILLVITKDNS